MSGRTIKIFITGNNPRSLKKVTMFNWSGHALFGTRDQIKQLSKRDESSESGIYFLLSGINSDNASFYIGETENFINRLRNHNASKDWWTHFIVFQSSGNNLNKAHVKFLEYEFYKLANESPAIELRNENKPGEISLSEEDKADVNIFMENILYILEGLNLGYFSIPSISLNKDSGIEYQTTLKSGSLKSFLIAVDDNYILKSGSFINGTAAESFKRGSSSYYKIWNKVLHSDKVEKFNDDTYKTKTDILFTSPSAAAAIVKARSSNGKTTWINSKTGKSIKDEEENFEKGKAA